MEEELAGAVQAPLRKSKFRQFWDWQPPLSLKGMWWYRIISDCKMPGVKDALKENLHVAFRLCWTTIVLGLFGCSGFWIVQSWMQISEEVIKLTPKNDPLSVGHIPMPAFTIGKQWNLNTSILEGIYKVTEALEKFEMFEMEGVTWTQQALDYVGSITNQVCSPWTNIGMWLRSTSEYPEKFNAIQESLERDAPDIWDNRDSDMLKKLAPFVSSYIPNCANSLKACALNGASEECDALFSDTITNLGSSCSFNVMPEEILSKNYNKTIKGWLTPRKQKLSEDESNAWRRWNPDKERLTTIKIKDSNETKQVPIVQKVAGEMGGLAFVLVKDEEEDSVACKQIEGSGYKFMVHSPTEVADLANQGTTIEWNHEVHIKVRATIIVADEDIRTVSKERRGCIFAEEEELGTYTKYTRDNCQGECLAQHIFAECKCLRLNDPKTENARLCTSKDDLCTFKAIQSFYKSGARELCPKCLPRCTDTIYDVTMSTFKYLPENPPQIVKMKVGPNQTTSVVKMYYDSRILHMKREFEHTYTEIFGDWGGIVGLINGLSVIEGCRLLAAFINVLFPWHAFDLILSYIWSQIRRWCLGMRRAPPVSVVEELTKMANSMFALAPTENLEIGERRRKSTPSGPHPSPASSEESGYPDLGEFFSRFLHQYDGEEAKRPTWQALFTYIVQWDAEHAADRVVPFQPGSEQGDNGNGIIIRDRIIYPPAGPGDNMVVIGRADRPSIVAPHMEVEEIARRTRSDPPHQNSDSSSSWDTVSDGTEAAHGQPGQIDSSTKAKERWNRAKAGVVSSSIIVDSRIYEDTTCCGGHCHGHRRKKGITQPGNGIEEPTTAPETGDDSDYYAPPNNNLEGGESSSSLPVAVTVDMSSTKEPSCFGKCFPCFNGTVAEEAEGNVSVVAGCVSVPLQDLNNDNNEQEGEIRSESVVVACQNGAVAVVANIDSPNCFKKNCFCCGRNDDDDASLDDVGLGNVEIIESGVIRDPVPNVTLTLSQEDIDMLTTSTSRQTLI